jgi:hypothetical protein
MWYHPHHGEFYGFARELVKKFPGNDEGNLTRVDKANEHGRHPLATEQSRGWVCREELLERLYHNGKCWRLIK